MKKIQVMIIPILLSMVIACASTPYTKDKLPGGIEYYPSEKQFEVTPSWYWRIRPNTEPVSNPDATIGHGYLHGKSKSAIVIGEYTKDERFYIAKWKEYGYFFIKQKDYQFAKKYKKYLVPLNYNADSYKRYGFEYHLLAYYEGSKDGYIRIMPESVLDDAERSTLNLKLIFNRRIVRSLMANELNVYSAKYSNVMNKVIQVYTDSGFINEFFVLTPCPIFDDFTGNGSVLAITSLAVDKVGTESYTNKLGMVMLGTLYKTEYLIVKWGKVYYALPCE